MIQPRYLLAFSVATLLWCGSFLAFTWLVDPYGVSPIRVSWHRVNEFKPNRLNIDRLIKPYEVWRKQPRTVFLGTSRIHQAIDPSVLDGTPYAPAYNGSIPASSLALNAEHLGRYLRLDRKLRTVVVELFFYNFVGPDRDHVAESWLDHARDTASLFASADALWASIRTVSYNLVQAIPCPEVTPGGYYSYAPGHDASATFKSFPAEIWKLHETRDGMRLRDDAFAAFRKIIRISREHGLDIRFVLTPNHAYDDYYLDSVGAWDVVEEWLKRLTSEGVAIYSFSQPNKWVDESVAADMKYWNDPYHFSLEMGRPLQRELFGITGERTPENFMVRMTPGMVAGHVKSREDAIRRWGRENPGFVKRFQTEKQKWEATRGPGKNGGSTGT